MIRILDFNTLRLQDILNRDIRAEEDVSAAVDNILADVREHGDEALRRYAEQFNGVSLDCLEVSPAEWDAAVDSVDPDFLETLRQAADNIRAFHEKQVHENFVLTRPDGVMMGQRYTPIEKVGICIPGSPVTFPSSVLMNAIPASIAGVTDIVMVTPPDKTGSISADALAAARLAGVTRVNHRLKKLQDIAVGLGMELEKADK